MVKIKQIYFFVVVVATYLLVSCGDEVQSYRPLQPSEVKYMLSPDSVNFWLMTERKKDGELLTGACSDSIIYGFYETALATKDKDGNSVSILKGGKPSFLILGSENCDRVGFCSDNPKLCASNDSVYKYNQGFCDAIKYAVGEQFRPNSEVIFLGTWNVDEKVSDTLKIELWQDTLKVKITNITSLKMSDRYKNTLDGSNSIFEETFRVIEF